jgi:hypothetical protein
MKRIGYDADTGCYYFRDGQGLVYKGPEGSEFGELTQGTDLLLIQQTTVSISYHSRRTACRCLCGGRW